MSYGERRFAYGRNTVDGCECPASAAGYAKDDVMTLTNAHVGDLARAYDRTVRYQLESVDPTERAGTLSEADAREVWLTVLDRARSSGSVGDPLVEKGEEIARELGWLE